MDEVLDLDGVEPPGAPPRSLATTVVAVRVPAFTAARLRQLCEHLGTSPNAWLKALIERELAGGLPADCVEWLRRQAAQLGMPGRPAEAEVAVLRHLADRWPHGARLR